MSKTKLSILSAVGLVALWGALAALRVYFPPAPTTVAAEAAIQPSLGAQLSLSALRPEEQMVVRFLFMLPLGALIVSIFRTVIGMPTFGTFAPVLLGLAFLDLKTIPGSLTIFILTVLVGWKLRWFLDCYRLLQVSRFSALLTLIVGFLIVIIRICSAFGWNAAQCISLFPLAILTHTAERFWTMETEDGPKTAFKNLLGTMFVSVCVALALSPHWATDWLFKYPEGLGLLLAVHLVLGRYTGYRLTELYRFSDLLQATDDTVQRSGEDHDLVPAGSLEDTAIDSQV